MNAQKPSIPGVIGEIVYQYCSLVRPVLTEGEVAIATGAIGNMRMKIRILYQRTNERGWENGAFERLMTAELYLGGLLNREVRANPKALEQNFHCLDREFNELDLVMRKSPEYEKYRQRSETDAPVLHRENSKA